MKGSRPRKPPLVTNGIEEGVGRSSYLGGDPYDHGREAKAPNPTAVAILEHNKDRIAQIARVSALQGIAISIARNEKGDVNEHTEMIRECIERLVADALENSVGQTSERLDLYDVRVLIIMKEGGTNRAKNLYALEVEVGIWLEEAILDVPASAYAAMRKSAEKWFPADEETP